MSTDDLQRLILDIDAAFEGGGDYYRPSKSSKGRIRQQALQPLGEEGHALRLRILQAAERLRAAR